MERDTEQGFSGSIEKNVGLSEVLVKSGRLNPHESVSEWSYSKTDSCKARNRLKLADQKIC